MQIYDPEWTTAVLSDLVDFFEANSMPASSVLAAQLIETVIVESEFTAHQPDALRDKQIML